MNIQTAIVIAGALIAGGIYAASERAEAQLTGPFAIATASSNSVWRINTETGQVWVCGGGGCEFISD